MVEHLKPYLRRVARAGGAVALGLAACALFGACPDAGGGAPSAQCSKTYEKCTLPTGVLGVCDPVDCKAGQAEPCLVCRSQH